MADTVDATSLTRSSLALFSIPVLGLIVGLTVLAYTVLVRRPEFPSKAPQIGPGNWPVVGSLGFWTARREWWRRAMSMSDSKSFSFHIGKHRVIGTASAAGRKTFFENSKELGFAEGYAVLFGQSPDFGSDKGDAMVAALHGTGEKQDQSMDAYFTRRIVHLIKRQNLQEKFPIVIDDVRQRLVEIATSGTDKTDPFDSIYKLVYLLTIRVVGATEIANDRKLQDKTLDLFQTIEQTAKPYQIMFPWLPSPALFKRFYAGSQMFMIFQRIVEARKKNNVVESDALQYLMDQGDDITRIIGFVVGALFAGQLNSGVNAAWVLCYLANSPRWTGEVRKEVLAVANKYSPDPSVPLLDKLSAIPYDAWETEFPNIDLCLKDSIRLQLHGTGFRKNISKKDVVFDGQVVPPESMLVFHFGDHHRDPTVYADPDEWDPSRYLPDRAEDKKAPYAYVGWGAGRHPCLGMRFAKLEQNIITAFWVAMFDFELLDGKTEQVLSKTPDADTNSYQASAPTQQLKLRFKVRDGVLV